MWVKMKEWTYRKVHANDEDNSHSIHLAFIDLCIYVIFLIVTTILTMSTRELSMYYYEQVIERLFVARPTYNEQEFEITFKDIVTVDDWWSFAQTTFRESFAQFDTRNNEQELALEGHLLIGVPRLRQIRVHNETCTIHDAFRNQFRTCYGVYSREHEDVSGFLNKTYYTKNEINTITIWGKIATYYGGGYIETLSPHSEANCLEDLKNASWIDRGTRVILIEFALFNSNVNLFVNTKLLAEIPPSGGILTSSEIQPLKYSVICDGYFKCICAIVFYGLIVYYTLELILIIITIGFCSFFRSMWNILDFIVIMFGYLSLVYVIWHTVYLHSILDNNALKNDPYLSLDVICYWNMFFVASMGICVFIVWIKTFKYIKLNKTMLQFSTTFERCSKDLIGFAIMFAIVFMAYADLSLLLFGTVHPDFRDFPSAVMTMIRMTLGDFNYDEMEEGNAYLAPIFFLSYVLFIFFILLNMFLAIMNDTYSEVKGEITEGKGNHFEEYINELFEKLRARITHTKKDQKSGGDAEDSSIPTEQFTEERDQTKLESNTRQILDRWFQVVSPPMTQEEEEALNQRIVTLERSLESLLEHLEEVLRKMKINKSKSTTRSM